MNKPSDLTRAARSRAALLALLLAALLSACGATEDRLERVDLVQYLGASVINFQSQTFNVPAELPLNEDLPASAGLEYTARAAPTQIMLVSRGNNLDEIRSAIVRLKIELTPNGFSGPANLRLIIGTMPSVYSDPTAATISRKQNLPALFDLELKDGKLLEVLQREEIFIGYEIVIEPRRLTSRELSVTAHLDELRLELEADRQIFPTH